VTLHGTGRPTGGVGPLGTRARTVQLRRPRLGQPPSSQPTFTPHGERPTGPARYATATVTYAAEPGHTIRFIEGWL
jgi:hypothetical protein